MLYLGHAANWPNHWSGTSFTVPKPGTNRSIVFREAGGAAKVTETVTSVWRSVHPLLVGLQTHSRSPIVAGRYAFLAAGSISRSPSGAVVPLSLSSGL